MVSPSCSFILYVLCSILHIALSTSSLATPSSCFDRIADKYPNMDSNSKTIVHILCDNQQAVIDESNGIYLSNDGIKAFSKAIETNTALTSLTLGSIQCISPDDDCTSTLDLVLSSALIVNRNLKTLSLSFEFAQSELIMEFFFKWLPCYNLTTFNAEAPASIGTLTLLRNTIQNNPYFPLQRFSGVSPTNPGLLGEAIGFTKCLKSIAVYFPRFWYSDMAAFATGAIANSRLEHYDFPLLQGDWTNQ
eukprot:PhF_6_TR38199/c1_g1_i1/m.57086